MQITNSVNAASRQWRKLRNNYEKHADQDRDRQSACQGRANPGDVDERRGTGPDQPAAELLVPLQDTAHSKDALCEGEADGDRQPYEERITTKRGGEEHADRVLRSNSVGEPLGRAAFGRIEKRCPRPRPGSTRNGLRTRTRRQVWHEGLPWRSSSATDISWLTGHGGARPTPRRRRAPESSRPRRSAADGNDAEFGLAPAASPVSRRTNRLTRFADRELCSSWLARGWGSGEGCVACVGDVELVE